MTKFTSTFQLRSVLNTSTREAERQQTSSQSHHLECHEDIWDSAFTPRGASGTHYTGGWEGQRLSGRCAEDTYAPTQNRTQTLQPRSRPSRWSASSETRSHFTDSQTCELHAGCD